MTAFVYTATRSLEKTSFNVTGTDISVDSTDDSFNATTTSLLGVLNNEWIDVNGFSTNAVNNGWFQVNGDSIATKIIEDSFTPLVTEAVGDIVTIQGYKRGLNQSYSIQTSSHDLTPSDRPVINSRTSLDGKVETIFSRIDAGWNILTDFISESSWNQWLEFMRSVSGGEPFSFDAFGSIASPDNPIQVRMDGRPSYSNPYARTMQIRMRVVEL